jgi:hypothetical protein
MYTDPLTATGASAATTAAVTGTTLAFTGAHVVGLIVLSVSLIFAGATLLAFARRRRPQPNH